MLNIFDVYADIHTFLAITCNNTTGIFLSVTEGPNVANLARKSSSQIVFSVTRLTCKTNTQLFHSVKTFDWGKREHEGKQRPNIRF